MARDRSLVRASDVGSWVYCHRAWWLARVKRVPHRHPALLLRGEAAHKRHGRRVTRAVRLRRVGLVLIVLGGMLGVAFLIFLLYGLR